MAMKLAKRRLTSAWLLTALCIVTASVRLILWLLNQTGPLALPDLLQALGWNWSLPVLFSLVAGLIIARQPRNRVGWLLMLPALVMIISPSGSLATPPPVLTLGRWLLLWLDGWLWVPMIFAIFLIPLYFPTGSLPSPRWNWVIRLALALWLFFMVLNTFVEDVGPTDYDWTLPNPIGFISLELVNGPFLIMWGIGLIAVASGSVLSLLLRYRRARTVERQQIKWLLFVGAIFVVNYSLVYFLSDPGLFGSVSALLNLLFVLSILAFPVAIAVAILRYRLYDIDVIIRRTLQYSVLTALLALIYFAAVVLLQTLFQALAQERSPVIIVLSTLLIAALFAPLRRGVQSVIDRRFFRQKYDAQQALARFAHTARDEVALEALTAELLGVVQETVHPHSASVWLKPGPK